MEKNIIKLLVILIIITFVGLLLILSKTSNIDNNMTRFCEADNNKLFLENK